MLDVRFAGWTKEDKMSTFDEKDMRTPRRNYSDVDIGGSAPF